MFLGVGWIYLQWGPPGDPLAVSAAQNAELLELTGTTARLSGEDILRTPVAYSQTIYAADQDQDRPGAVVLVRDDDPATAVATTRLQHFPVNAPMLFVTDEGATLPEATRDELERLGPEGVMMDNNVQVYLVGDIAPTVAEEIEVELGYNTRQIYAPDPVTFTERLDEFLAVLDSNHSDVVLIGDIDNLEYSYCAANWNAHMGKGFAYVSSNGVPEEDQADVGAPRSHLRLHLRVRAARTYRPRGHGRIDALRPRAAHPWKLAPRNVRALGGL